jgi:hypothetical protein
MFGKNPRINPLAARKQLLLAESEINRAQMVHDGQMMANGVRSLTHRARSMGAFALAAASLVSGLVSFRRSKPAPAGEKLAWWQTLLKGALLAGSLWAQFNPRPKS